MQKRDLKWLLAIFSLAYTVRLIFLFQLKGDYFFFFHPAVDAADAHKEAINIAGGDLLDKKLFIWQAPFYMYFLAVTYKLTSLMRSATQYSAIFTVKMLQILVGSVNCLLIGYIGTKVFNRRTGIVAGFIAALYGPFMVFEADLTGVVFHILFNFLGLILLMRAAETKKPHLALAAGVVIGLSVLTVPNIMLFLLVAAVWIFYAFGKTTIRPAVLLITGCLVVILPWTLRNYVVQKAFIPISPNAGLNFYIGTNANYDKTINIRPGLQWDVLMSMPESEGISYRLSSDYYFSKSWQFIKKKPLAYVGLLFRKLYAFWHGAEVKRNQDMYTHRFFSKLFAFLVWKDHIAFPFGIIGPLSLIGLILSLKKRGPIPLLLFLFVATYMLSVILFFVTDRYRIPAVAGLIIYASYAIIMFFDYATSMDFRTASLMIVSCAALLVMLNLNTGTDTRIDPEYYFLKGADLMQARDYRDALVSLDTATKLDPSNPDAFYRKGIVCMKLGEEKSAKESFDSAMKLEPLYRVVICKKWPAVFGQSAAVSRG